MIRLRQSLERWARHPVAGPFLLLLLALILAFAVLHVLEHGITGVVASCAVMAAFALPLLYAVARRGPTAVLRLPCRRGPPRAHAAARPTPVRPVALLALPLRR